jgi:hypothetical protein
MCNAWMFLSEDDPIGPHGWATTTYPDTNSAYQRMIAENVYNSVDMLFLCFAETTSTSDLTTPPGDGTQFTLQMGASTHPSLADGVTSGYPVRFSNQNYLRWVIRDARAANPNIKILMTLVWGRGTDLANVFLPSGKTDAQNAADFATNLLLYLRHYDLDGFDIDWESPLSDLTSESQLSELLTAIGKSFARQEDKKFWLTLSPAVADNLDGATVNAHVDFVNLQLYSGFTFVQDFISRGIDPDKLAYGAKFEGAEQSAKTAYATFQSGGYRVTTQWRLNSANFAYEQDNQIEYHKLVHGT